MVVWQGQMELEQACACLYKPPCTELVSTQFLNHTTCFPINFLKTAEGFESIDSLIFF